MISISSHRRVTIGGVIFLASVLPFILQSNYHLGIAHQVLIFIVLSSGYNILLGLTGLVSFGHIALFAVGAYTSAFLVKTIGLSFMAGLAGAGCMAGLVGLLTSILALRIKGHYLTLLTLALGEVIRLMIRSMESVTHGSEGFSSIPRPDVFGFVFRSGFSLYYLLLVFAVLTVIFVWRLKESRYGRAFMAIRDAEIGAEVGGVDTARMKILAFTTSAVIAGIAGCLYAHTMRFISPEFFSLGLTITLLAMVLLGGRGTIAGPIMGAILLVVLPESLRFIKDYYLVAFGLVIWAVALLLPEGLMGLVKRLMPRLPEDRR